MSKTIFSEYDRNAVVRQIIAILKSPQGRDLGRWYLIERGKGDAGDIAQVNREIGDIWWEQVRALYTSPEPVNSRS